MGSPELLSPLRSQASHNHFRNGGCRPKCTCLSLVVESTPPPGPVTCVRWRINVLCDLGLTVRTGSDLKNPKRTEKLRQNTGEAEGTKRQASHRVSIRTGPSPTQTELQTDKTVNLNLAHFFIHGETQHNSEPRVTGSWHGPTV